MIKPREIQLNAKAVGVRDQRYTFYFYDHPSKRMINYF